VKIPRGEDEPAEQVRVVHEPLGDQVRDAGLALHLALHAHEPGAEQGAALALGELLEDDEVHLAGLVLQRDEGDVVGRGRTLAVDDEAGGADHRAGGGGLDIACAAEAEPAQALAQQGQRVAAEREADAGVVGDDVAALRGCRQQGQRGLRRRQRQAGLDRRRSLRAPPCLVRDRANSVDSLLISFDRSKELNCPPTRCVPPARCAQLIQSAPSDSPKILHHVIILKCAKLKDRLFVQVDLQISVQ
jgi:uncharacterized protein YciI